MTLGWKRFGAGLGGLGALLLAPYLAGAAILLSLGLSLESLRFDLAWSYWLALDVPAYAPYATRIRWAGWIGFALAPLAWFFVVGRPWLRDRHLRPPKAPPAFASRSALRELWPKAHPARLPADASLLIVGPDYGAAAAALLPALRDNVEPMLAVDIDGALHAMAATWRAAHGPVHQIAPLGGGAPWNPLAHLCQHHRLQRDDVRQLAARWYAPGKMDVFIHSLVENAFLALLGVANDVLRNAGDAAIPAPGDVARLANLPLTRATIDRLARLPQLRPETRDALHAWLSIDDATLAEVARHLREPLALFLDPVIDQHTRGPLQPLDGTVFLHVPYARRADLAPLFDTLRLQLRHERLLIVHGLDLLPSPPLMARQIATIVSLKRMLTTCTPHADTFAQRFALLTWLGPGQRAGADEEVDAIATFLTAHGQHGKRFTGDDTRAAFRRLRAGQQVVISPRLDRPVRCKPVTAHAETRRQAPDTPQGTSVPVPKPIAALLASFAAVAVETVPAGGWFTREPPAAQQAIPTKVVNLGPHRFRLPMNLFDGQDGFNPDKTEIWMAWSWPELQPLPMGVNYHDDMTMFISTVNVSVHHLDALDDVKYAHRLQAYIEPRFSDPIHRENPAENLHMRIKGAPLHGLTPYFMDFERIGAYYASLYGPGTPAAEPGGLNEDWYLRTDANGMPLTVIMCDPREIPDGTYLEDGRIVDAPVNGRRATCSHVFLLPEYKAIVRIEYQRTVLHDWRRIEDLITGTLRQAKVSE